MEGGGVLVFHLLHNKCKICCSYAFSVIINIVHVQEIFAKFEITEYGRFFVIQISKLGRSTCIYNMVAFSVCLASSKGKFKRHIFMYLNDVARLLP